VLTAILEKIKPQTLKPEDETYALLRIKPSDLGKIALCALDQLKKPNILLNSIAVTDYSDTGPLNHEALSVAEDLEIRDGQQPVMGFHGSPTYMWVNNSYTALAEDCARNGWLTIGA
jgi:hypothetical protein